MEMLEGRILLSSIVYPQSPNPYLNPPVQIQGTDPAPPNGNGDPPIGGPSTPIGPAVPG